MERPAGLDTKRQKGGPFWGGKRGTETVVDIGQTEYITRLTALRDSLIDQEQMYLAQALDRLRIHSLSNKSSSYRLRMNSEDDGKGTSPCLHPPTPRTNMVTTVEKFRQMRPKRPPPIIFPLEGRQLIESHLLKENESGSGSELSRSGTTGSITSKTSSRISHDVSIKSLNSKVDETVQANLQRLLQPTSSIPNIGRKALKQQESFEPKTKALLNRAGRNSNNSRIAGRLVTRPRPTVPKRPPSMASPESIIEAVTVSNSNNFTPNYYNYYYGNFRDKSNNHKNYTSDPEGDDDEDDSVWPGADGAETVRSRQGHGVSANGGRSDQNAEATAVVSWSTSLPAQSEQYPGKQHRDNNHSGNCATSQGNDNMKDRFKNNSKQLGGGGGFSKHKTKPRPVYRSDSFRNGSNDAEKSCIDIYIPSHQSYPFGTPFSRKNSIASRDGGGRSGGESWTYNPTVEQVTLPMINVSYDNTEKDSVSKPGISDGRTKITSNFDLEERLEGNQGGESCRPSNGMKSFSSLPSVWSRYCGHNRRDSSGSCEGFPEDKMDSCLPLTRRESLSQCGRRRTRVSIGEAFNSHEEDSNSQKESDRTSKRHIVVDMPSIIFNAASPDVAEDSAAVTPLMTTPSKTEATKQQALPGQGSGSQSRTGYRSSSVTPTAGVPQLSKAVKQQEIRQRELNNLLEDVRELNHRTEVLSTQAEGHS